MPSWSFHVVASSKISLFMADFLIHSFTDGYVSCFHILAVVVCLLSVRSLILFLPYPCLCLVHHWCLASICKWVLTEDSDELFYFIVIPHLRRKVKHWQKHGVIWSDLFSLLPFSFTFSLLSVFWGLLSLLLNYRWCTKIYVLCVPHSDSPFEWLYSIYSYYKILAIFPVLCIISL